MREEIREKFGPYAISLRMRDGVMYVWAENNDVFKKVGDDWKKIGALPECTEDGRSYLNYFSEYLGKIT